MWMIWDGRDNFHFALEAAAMGMLDILAGILVWADTIRYVDWMSGWWAEDVIGAQPPVELQSSAV